MSRSFMKRALHFVLLMKGLPEGLVIRNDRRSTYEVP